jgi:hypothetical protein
VQADTGPAATKTSGTRAVIVEKTMVPGSKGDVTEIVVPKTIMKVNVRPSLVRCGRREVVEGTQLIGVPLLEFAGTLLLLRDSLLA